MSNSAIVLQDPLEPWNRGIWKFNKQVLRYVINPVTKTYRKVLPAEVRQAIVNFTRNINYPRRVLNELLQKRWCDAKDETYRFLCNSTIGIAGLFDPASKIKIAKPNASLGQTLSYYGWQSKYFFMLPFLGPSSMPHAVGVLGDSLLDPLRYYLPTPYINSGVQLLNSEKQSNQLALLIAVEADSYDGVRLLWPYIVSNKKPDWGNNGTIDSATLDTLGVLMMQQKDPYFIEKGKLGKVCITSTKKKMLFNYWLQPKPAPLVYFAPGLGAHRLSPMSILIAELLYARGYSIVTLTSVFHPEFINKATNSVFSGYLPKDTQDLHRAITVVDCYLQKKLPYRVTKRALIGCSMGGYQTLYLAATEKNNNKKFISFDRYVAINSPISLQYGMQKLSEFQQAALAWPVQTRAFRMSNALHKGVYLGAAPQTLKTNITLDSNETKFLVGLSFSRVLRDLIYNISRYNGVNLTKKAIKPSRRKEAYRAISNITFNDYYQNWVKPYYKKLGVSARDFNLGLDLKNYSKQLTQRKKIWFLSNHNDFLLQKKDIVWLKKHFNTKQLTLFPRGGHLGNLQSKPMQHAILQALQGL